MRKLFSIFPVVIVLSFSYWSVAPLLSPGFFPMHDDTQVARVFEMQKSLNSGMFPVRWVADLGYGYGYPIFNYYAPFAYYIGGILNLSGMDALTATKIMMALGIILSGVFMYFFAKEFWGKIGGVISAVLYIYAPYHALDIYVRGDVAEFWAYAFIPLAFLGIYKIFLFSSDNIKTQKKKSLFDVTKQQWYWTGTAAVGYAGIILCHNLTAMMVTPFLFLFTGALFLYSYKNSPHTKPYLIFVALLVGILLSAFYWLPALAETGYTNVASLIKGGSQYKDHFVCLSQLWNSPWGFGGSAPGCVDGISFKIGKLHILFSVLSLIPLIYFWKKNKMIVFIGLFSLFALAFSVFLTLQQSKFIWDAFSPMAFFQFPWRFLIMISFFISFLSGAIFYFIYSLIESRQIARIGFSIIAGIAIIIIIVFNAKVFYPQKFVYKTVADYTNAYALQWITSKISDEYMPKGFVRPQTPNSIPKNKFSQYDKPITVDFLRQNTISLQAEITAKQQAKILINEAYFPGWHIFVDNQPVGYSIIDKGIIVTVPSGKHMIVMRFMQTGIEKIGDLLSIAGICILLLGIINTSSFVYEHKKK